jgi:hypothetical protein
MILTVTLNPCVHRYLLYREEVPPRTVVRLVRERMSSGGKAERRARDRPARRRAVALDRERADRRAPAPVPARAGRGRLVPVAVPTRLSTACDLANDAREFLEEEPT